MISASFPADSLSARAARNFFTHSGHVPLVLLILESLLASPGYFSRADPYLLLAAGISQAFVMEWLAARGRPMLFLANLSGPLFYSLVEAGMEGVGFFQQWHHQAYWAFALGFALLQSAQARRAAISGALLLAENVLRSAIPLVMYALFEARTKNTVLSVEVFFADRAHDFLAVVLLLLGVLLGFADINLRRSLATVQSLTARLRQYSEWSLGRGILDRAIADESTLSLQRVGRAVLFLDIRGFTAWSEQQTPEAVVGMLNGYYLAAEQALVECRPIKLKFTADEVMAVFADASGAIQAGRHNVHPWRADEVTDKLVFGPVEQRVGRAHLHRAAPRHHHHLVSEGQGLDLVVGDVDQRELELVVDLLQLAPQLPFQVRIDHRQRFVEQHRRDVLANQTAAQTDLLLGVGRQPGGALVQLAAELEHLGDFADPGLDPVRRNASVLQRESQVFGHRHRVVDHRKLEHLRDVARLWRLERDIFATESHRALRRLHQARDEVEHRRLAAARWAEQGVGAAVFETHLQRQQRVIAVGLRIGFVAVRQVQVYACHVRGSFSRVPAAGRRRRRKHRPASGRGRA